MLKKWKRCGNWFCLSDLVVEGLRYMGTGGKCRRRTNLQVLRQKVCSPFQQDITQGLKSTVRGCAQACQLLENKLKLRPGATAITSFIKSREKFKSWSRRGRGGFQLGS